MELEPPGINPPDDAPYPDEDPIARRIEQALDDGRDDEALALAEEALAAGEGDRLDLLFLGGFALLGLGDPAAAEQRFRIVLAEDHQCPSSRCWLAMALYRLCRFAEAEAEVALALQNDSPVVDAHVVQGLVLERRGEFGAADACFARAAELDPERYWVPLRLDRKEFDRELRKAIRRLPRQFRKHLDRVPVIVQEIPEERLLMSEDGTGAHDPDLLGLFDGVAITETGESWGGDLPPPNYIYLFQRNLERFARDRDDLVEQITVTVYHEIGHYLGLDEQDLDDLGLG